MLEPACVLAALYRFPAQQVSETLADGLRTQSIGAINFEHISAYVDDIVSVTEDEIREDHARAKRQPADGP